MIDSWNAAKLNERITQVEKKIQAEDVIANPTGAATDALEKISIDGDIYSVSGASELNELSDVTITTPGNGDLLSYDSTAEKWENVTGGIMKYKTKTESVIIETTNGYGTATFTWNSETEGELKGTSIEYMEASSSVNDIVVNVKTTSLSVRVVSKSAQTIYVTMGFYYI